MKENRFTIEMENDKVRCQLKGDPITIARMIAQVMEVNDQVKIMVLTTACAYCHENNLPIQDVYKAAIQNLKS